MLRMGEADIKATAQFVREFVTTGLIPWMEKAVIDWNEAVSLNHNVRNIVSLTLPI